MGKEPIAGRDRSTCQLVNLTGNALSCQCQYRLSTDMWISKHYGVGQDLFGEKRLNSGYRVTQALGLLPNVF